MTKTVKSGEYISGLCCHSKIARQAEELGGEESQAVQQRQMQILAVGRITAGTHSYWGSVSWKPALLSFLCREEPGCSCKQQADDEPDMSTHNKSSQQLLRLL